ncbi:MAG TPA: S8/S53 family peptidase [Solirubrobacteraceae bacterium]|nr:S8/S53 family peptidase [Solirubrobacteraceae bacterium]
MIEPARKAGRAFRRAPLLLVLAGLACFAYVAVPQTAAAEDDATPTWWHEAAGLTPLLTAPPPPNPATICVIDTGVTPTPDLDITARWAYDGGTPDDVRATPDSPGHGTLVAHFAAAAVNGWGGAGAFPHARISSVRVFPREGGASWREYIAAISRCLKLDANTKVIVISIGGQDIEPGQADELEAHIDQARNLYGVNVVAAAGNGPDAPDFPGRFPAAFTTAATAPEGQLCAFSARGPAVDIGAPGCDLLQANYEGTLWQLGGTSFAAPLVAGALAAIRSYVPTLTADAAEAALTSTARFGDPPLLDAAATLESLGVGASASTAPLPTEPRPGGSRTKVDVRAVPTVSRHDSRIVVPRVRIRRTRRAVLLVAQNRPARAVLEVRVEGRTLRAKRRIRVRRHVGFARCRFTIKTAASRWITVRW